MADEVTTHAIPTGGVAGASVTEDGRQVLLRFVDSPVGVTVPRATLPQLAALAIDASGERLAEAGETHDVRAVRMGRFSVGGAGGRVLLSVQTENGAGSLSFDLPPRTARELADALAAFLAAGAGG